MSDHIDSVVAAAFGELPAPEVQPACTECLEFKKWQDSAAAQQDGSAETDARVLWRNHLAHIHDITYQGVSYSSPSEPDGDLRPVNESGASRRGLGHCV
jgi:hypothetical protein